MRVEIPTAVKAAVERAYDLTTSEWIPLRTTPSRQLYRTTHEPAFVVRVSQSLSAGDVEEEAALVNRLSTAGFTRVSKFRSALGGHFATELGDGSVVSVYRYAHGSVQQPLSDQQFSRLVLVAPVLFDALGRIPPEAFPNRRRFPHSTDIAAKAAAAIGIHPQLARLQVCIDSEPWAPFVDALKPIHVIHSDLHAGNMVWSSRSLEAIIDFGSFKIGNQALDVAALLTGTCFSYSTLDLDRFIAIISACREVFAEAGVDFDQIVPLCTLVALHFFGVDHDLAGQRHREQPAELRDALRAVELVDRRREIERAVAGLVR